MKDLKSIFKKEKASPSKSARSGFRKFAEGLDVWPGSGRYRLLQFFVEKKRASEIDSKVLIQRTNNFSDEQLRILKLLCKKDGFSVRTILDSVKSIKTFGLKRLLTLRAFVDLEGVRPDSLHQFLRTNLPLGDQKTKGHEAWEKELKEKMMNHGQMTVFYNICNRVPGVTPKTAISAIPKIRLLKPQHAQIINHFLKEDSSFNDKPIKNNNIVGLIGLWLRIPEIDNKGRFKLLIKRLSRKPDKQKKDFLFIIHSLKTELEKEKRNAFENILFSIRNLLD